MKTFGSILRMMKNRYVAGATISATTTFAKDAGLKTGGGFTRGRRTSMKLIDAKTVVTVQLYDAEFDDYATEEMTIEDYLDRYAEGVIPVIEAIPVKWIEEHIKWLISLGVAPSHQIRAMVARWKEEQ